MRRPLQLLVLSDTHVGKPTWGRFGELAFEDAIRLASRESVDVVLHCGDMVGPDNAALTLEHGLKLLAAIPARHHLWVAGNNDLRQFWEGGEQAWDYEKRLSALAARYDVHLLDERPLVVDDVMFAGNFGYYDLTLWRPPSQPDAKFPADLLTLERDVARWHREHLGLDFRAFFERCQKRLRDHANEADGRPVVLATHTVPTAEMVIYGRSAEYDFQNAFMGWDDGLSDAPLAKVPNLVLQLCGHTHRAKRIERPGSCPLMNVSGDGQPHRFTV